MTFTQKLMRILFVPAVVMVALLAMYTRVSHVTDAVESGKVSQLLSPAMAVAEEKPAPSSPAAAAGNSGTALDQTPSPPVANIGKVGDDETDTVLTDADIKILQQLGERRKELDKREDSIVEREALLTAAEQRIDEKVAELQKMREDLEKLLAQADTQQSDQLKSLVKIYENMKPPQAARIFEQLEMNMLISVIQEMKEAKAAPVLAAMDPVKAKAVTAELIRRKELPKLNAAPAGQ
ncbi:MAG: MotE family protein [Bdellovibrionales bacterium]